MWKSNMFRYFTFFICKSPRTLIIIDVVSVGSQITVYIKMLGKKHPYLFTLEEVAKAVQHESMSE